MRNKKIGKIIASLGIAILCVGGFNNWAKETWNVSPIDGTKSCEVVDTRVVKVEKNEEVEFLFSEYQLDETNQRKSIYRVDVDIKNSGNQEVGVLTDLGYVKTLDDNGYYIYNRVENYYWKKQDADTYLYKETIPAGQTGTVSYFLVMDEGTETDVITMEFGNMDGVKTTVNMPK